MSILVTGGAGYIGSHICVELLNIGYDVIVVDNFSNSNPNVVNRIQEITGRTCKLYNINILNKENLEYIFYQNDIEAVIHLAGYKSVSESIEYPIKYYINNVTGTLVLCEIMRKYGVKNFVFSSSATVYGLKNKSPLTEDLLLEPTNPYGWSKLIIEKILQDIYTSDNEWNIIILRYFNPIGAHKSGLIGENPNGIPNNLMPYVTQVAVGKLEILNIFGDDYNTHDGTGVRDYIHVVDLARGHLKALEKVFDTTPIKAFNLGTGIGYSVLDVVKNFEVATGIKIPYIITNRRSGDVDICYADSSKAEQELGWKAEKTLIDMCKDSWNWQLKNISYYN